MSTLVALPFLVCAQHHPVYSGQVVKVIDGTTLEIKTRAHGLPNEITLTAHLWGIELSKDKKHIAQAKQLLVKLALNRDVIVDVFGTASDWVQVRKEESYASLSTALVSAGLASRLKPRGDYIVAGYEKELKHAEDQAKAQKLGIWKSTK